MMEKTFEEVFVELCDTFGVSYLCSPKDFLQAASEYFYPSGVDYPPNREERRKGNNNG